MIVSSQLHARTCHVLLKRPLAFTAHSKKISSKPFLLKPMQLDSLIRRNLTNKLPLQKWAFKKELLTGAFFVTKVWNMSTLSMKATHTYTHCLHFSLSLNYVDYALCHPSFWHGVEQLRKKQKTFQKCYFSEKITHFQISSSKQSFPDFTTFFWKKGILK